MENKKENKYQSESKIKKTVKVKTIGTGKMVVVALAVSFIFSSLFGAAAGFMGGSLASKYFPQFLEKAKNEAGQKLDRQIIPDESVKVVEEQSAIIEAVKKVNPAVVSIIITKDLPKIERYYYDPFGEDFWDDFGGSPFSFKIPSERQNGTEKREIGGGTGFIVSPDGVIVTNKHVVSDTEAEYTILMNDGQKYPAKVLARDPSNDIAILKIDKDNLPTVEMGNSDALQVGQTAIAIGNALGEFRNTVSVGVVSGLKRSITASGGIGSASEQLFGVIQTDAAINHGNSGGPLVNIDGQVIGINVAIAEGAQGIGFALPINDVKKVVNDVKTHGKILRPYLGVRYLQIDKEIQKKNNLPVDYGALIVRGENSGELAVIPSSPANKVGLVENDIILEVDGVKLDGKSSLANIIQRHNVGDEIELKILHQGKEKTVKVKLEERT